MVDDDDCDVRSLIEWKEPIGYLIMVIFQYLFVIYDLSLYSTAKNSNSQKNQIESNKNSFEIKKKDWNVTQNLY